MYLMNIIIKHTEMSVIGTMRLLRSVKSIPPMSSFVHSFIHTEGNEKREYVRLRDPVNRTNECLQQIVSVYICICIRDSDNHK